MSRLTWMIGPEVFFFSSRRRHTRCSRDWSSDVCSSDLRSPGAVASSGFPFASGMNSHSRASRWPCADSAWRSEEHTSELQSRLHLVCRLLLEKKNILVFIDMNILIYF